jgi:hypothetical protein
MAHRNIQLHLPGTPVPNMRYTAFIAILTPSSVWLSWTFLSSTSRDCANKVRPAQLAVTEHKMKTIIQIIANGILAIADTYTSPRAYSRPAPDGFLKDQENLRGDVKQVGADLSQTITKYGQQSNQPSGYR